MSGSATITVIVARTKRKLKEAGATSEEEAKTPKELDLNERWLKMSAHAGVVATKDGRYYITSKKKVTHARVSSLAVFLFYAFDIFYLSQFVPSISRESG
jgi:hypothetical protein